MRVARLRVGLPLGRRAFSFAQIPPTTLPLFAQLSPFDPSPELGFLSHRFAVITQSNLPGLLHIVSPNFNRAISSANLDLTVKPLSKMIDVISKRPNLSTDLSIGPPYP